jgi:hypothetical protein
MTVLPPAITAATAQQRLTDDGLAAMGLTFPLLSDTWSSAAVTFDETQLTLTMTGAVQAPVLAIRSWVTDLANQGVYGLDGFPFSGTGAVIRLHPQAALRLDRLVRRRLDSAAGDIRPVPQTMIIRNVSDNLSPQWFDPGDTITASGLVTFHDERGLIIDPVAVAGLCADLLNELPALGPTPSAAPGGVATIAGLGTAGTFVHVVDPHGGPFRAVDGIEPRVMSGATDVGPVPATGLVQLAAGESIGVPAASAERLRVGFSRNATLGRDSVTVPALPGGVSLHRQFLRVTAVDLQWHLLGNRSASTQHGVGPDDQTMPDEFKPQVRDRVRMDLTVDGVGTLGTAAAVLAPPNSGGFSGFMFAVSPTLDAGVGLPPSPDANGRWPAFPAQPAGMPGPAPTGTPDSGVTAVWSGPRDVVLTFAAGTLPLGSHVRVYPKIFKLITAITAEQPSFLRGDGAAGLVNDVTVDLSLALQNPLDLPDTANQPADSTLTFDLVLVDRAGTVTARGAVTVPVTVGTAPAVVDPFATPDLMAIVPDNVRGIAPSPLFGVPSPVTPPGAAPTSVVDLLRALASETTPRIGPRLPTMARFPTLAVVATDDGAAHTWEALVTGGRWSRETRSADAALANPGGPAGPDIHAPGVRVDGQAAFDVGQIALRRAQPLLPLGAGGLGWVPFVGDADWDPPAEPADDSAPAGQSAARTSAAAVLRTVAVAAESPELTLPAIPIPAADASVQNLVNSIASALGVAPPTVNITREAEMVREIRREFHWSRFGSRDAQWALRRALRQARDLVFVSSPQFSSTAHAAAPPQAHEVDLVAELETRMTEQPGLLVVVCVPRWPDYDPAFGGWVRQAFAARNEALKTLTDVDASRVVAFHPRGFPGRSASIRGTTVIVDDNWLLSGTSHWRRRGLTFDEGVDIVGFDRQLDDGGASTRIRAFRRAYMAALAGVAANEPEFARLFDTRSCADVIADLVSQGGLGRLAPFWPGPTDTDVLPQTAAVADPDGGTSDDYLALFATLLAESP